MVELNYPDGATPLDRDEMQGLILTNITNREELNRWEQDNINEALVWIGKKQAKRNSRRTFYEAAA